MKQMKHCNYSTCYLLASWGWAVGGRQYCNIPRFVLAGMSGTVQYWLLEQVVMLVMLVMLVWVGIV